MTQVLTLLDKRVGAGFWRRGGESPSNVKWEDRITEVREGSWSYVAGSIGRAPGMFLELFHSLCVLSPGVIFWQSIP